MTFIRQPLNMPTITDVNTTILVTGSNGYIGMWVVDSLLKRGHSVRAAVRTETRGQHLLETFKSYGSKVQLFPIGDIEAVSMLVFVDSWVR